MVPSWRLHWYVSLHHFVSAAAQLSSWISNAYGGGAVVQGSLTRTTRSRLRPVVDRGPTASMAAPWQRLGAALANPWRCQTHGRVMQRPRIRQLKLVLPQLQLTVPSGLAGSIL
eukprot:m.138105 g.138105  ORF g.138105 m.138105 type:complete len:114 (-) comp22714_c0_seq6:3447-3788(-)